MSDDCQFPGCESDATATYCEECRQSVRGPRSSAGMHPIWLVLVPVGSVTFSIVVSAIVLYLL